MLCYVDVCYFADENAEGVFAKNNMLEYHTYFETRAKTVNGIIRASNRALGKRYGMPMPIVATDKDIAICDRYGNIINYLNWL